VVIEGDKMCTRRQTLIGLILLNLASAGRTLAQAPTIASISPTSGAVGVSVTISGTNFGASQAGSTVKLNGTTAAVSTWSATSIVVVVPSGASSGTFAVTVGGQTANSSSFTATSLLSGWTDADVGSVGVSGSGTYVNGTFTVKGSGNSIWGTSDTFNFAYQPLSGDGTIVARLVSAGGGASSQSTGVMIRETLNANSTNVYTLLGGGNSEIYVTARTTTNGSTSVVANTSAVSFAYWVKLSRSGSTFTGYSSVDGVNWTQVGAMTISMAQNVYVGLAVSSNYNQSLETATFDGVSISSAASAAPVVTSYSASTGSVGSAEVISGSNFGTTQGSSLVLLGGTPLTVDFWSSTAIVAVIPSGAASGRLSIYLGPTMNSAASISFTVTPNPLPSGWLDTDIGNVGIAGSATYSSGAFTIVGAGVNNGGTADALHLAYLPLSGDGSIVARVTSISGGSYPGFVTVRETLTQGAIATSVTFYPNQSSLNYRSSTSGYYSSASGTFVASQPPYWFRLTRIGSTFTGYMSSDGLNWAQAGSVSVTMAQNAYIGLGVSSGSTSSTATVIFDNVEVSSAVTPDPTITAVSATTGSIGSQIAISGAHFGASQGNSFVMVNNSVMTVNQWTDSSIIATIPTGATSGHLLVTVAPSLDDSNFVNFTVTADPLPAGWLDQDIGVVGLVGSAGYANGTFTVTGAGQAVTNTPDRLHFAYLPLSGDGTIVAHLTGYSGSSNTQAVLMIRETLDPGATNVSAQFIPSQVYLNDRSTSNGSISSTAVGFLSASLPYWLKLTRSGNTFNGYVSRDGVNWDTPSSSVTVTMAQNVYIGLAVTSTSTTALSSFTFDNVSVSSSSAPAPVISSLSATTGSVGTQITISGSNFGSSQATSLVTLNTFPLTVNSWSSTSITVTVPVGASSGPLLVALGPSMIDSNYVNFTVTTNPLPSGWLDQDIGSPGVTGQASYTNGVFTVAGGGLIGNNADAFHFVYQQLSGDGTITVRLVNSGSSESLGVMIRETLSANATNAFTSYYLGYQSAYFTDRSSAGGGTTTAGPNSLNLPGWLKVTRSGSTFAAYISPDGTYWTQVGSGVTISMASSVYVGLAVGSGYTGSLSSAAFDNVSVTAGTPPATPNITGISPTSGTVNTSVTISGSNFGATQGSSSVRFNGAVATTITSWSNTQIVASVPSAASTGPLTVIVNGIGSNKNFSFTFYNPVISSISPPQGPAGGMINLNGSGFGALQSNSTVQFNGAAVAGIDSWSDTNIRLNIPTSASLGQSTLNVTVGGITSANAQFTVIESMSISGISPTSGSVGTNVTINGGGFGATQSNSVANFWGVAANIVSWSDTSIVTTVPSGTSTGNVSVTVAGNTTQGPLFTLTSTVALIDSLNNSTTYNAAVVGGIWRITSSQGSGCSSCTQRGNITKQYDSFGNVASRTDENGNTTTYTYDSNGNVLTVVEPAVNGSHPTTTYTYNSFNEVLTVTDPLGFVTTNTYDANGNLLTVTTPRPNGNTAASVTTFTYDSNGQLLTIKDPLNNVTTLTYTTAGLVATIKDAQNNVTTYGYDTFGNRTSVTDALNHQTTFTHDAMNRLTKITYPDTTTTQFAYDSRGRRTSVTDQNGKVTQYGYDDADRLTTVTDGANNVTTYGYDTEDNLTSITDANSHATTFTYDAFGRVTKTTFPSGYIETYGYDSANNLTSKTDRKNQLISYTYDQLNRLMQKSYPDTSTVNYTYDLNSRLTQVTDPTGTYQFTFDNMGRLTGASANYTFLSARTFTTGYAYDAASNRTGFTDPEGGSTVYVYDTLNRLQTLTPPAAFTATGNFGFGYDALSRRTQLTRPNSIATNYSYDNLSRLLSVLHQAGSTTLDGASYTVDNAGNRTSKTDQRLAVTSNYTYDQIYELTQVTQAANTVENYTYDPVGNRSASLGVSPYTYNTSNELTSTPSTSYTYDNNGNLLTSLTGSNTTTYTWDFENRLSSVTLPGSGGTVSFAYDPFGRRIKKVSSAGTSIFAYDSKNLIEETNGTGAVVARYTQTQNIDEPLAMLRSSATSYYEADGLGSITSLSNPAGALAQTYTFDSFGKQTASSGSLVNPFQYTAREFDPEISLYNYRERYYDPSVGRFLSEDPIRPDDAIDFYAYVSNNPINFTDPLGLYGTDPEVPLPVPPRIDKLMKCMDNCTGKAQYVTGTVNGTGTSNGGHLDPGHAGGTSVDIKPVGTPSSKIFCCAQQCEAVWVIDERKTKFHYHIMLEMTIHPRGQNMIPHTPECSPKGCNANK
jgi:RHS repeat-associated protein